MGNCTGIFSNCQGGESHQIAGAQTNAIKRVEKEQMEKAIS